MKVNPVKIEYAHGVLSLTNKTSTHTQEFDATVREIHKGTLRVDPYIVQDSRYARIPGEGLCSYLLIPPGQGHGHFQYGDGLQEQKIELKERIVQDEDLIKEVSGCDPKAKEPAVVLIDGENYPKETIEALPFQENVFVLFPPHGVKRTLPVVEAKRYLRKGISPKGGNHGPGIERVYK